MVIIDQQTGGNFVSNDNAYTAQFATVQGTLEQLVCVAVASIGVEMATVEVATPSGRTAVAVFGDYVDRPAYFLEVPIHGPAGELIAFFCAYDSEARTSTAFDLEVLQGLADSAKRKMWLAWSEAGPRSAY